MALAPLLPDWKAAKTEFEKVTGTKKPSEKFLGLFRKSSGIEDDLKAIDALATLPALDDKKMQALKKSFGEFKKTSAAYQKMLKDAADKDVASNPAAKTDLYRGLKMLSARLDKYEATVDQVVSDDTAAAGGKVDVNKMLEAASKLAVSGTKKGLVMCVSAIKAIKLSPTPAIWDKEMQPAARTLTTGLQNYKVADKNAKHMDKHVKALTPYASGALATMKSGTSPADVQAGLAAFTVIVKDVAKDYPDGKYPD